MTPLYPPWIRFWHWTNALLFTVLLITGTSMHFAEPGAAQVDFRTARIVHNSSGVLITLNYLLFVFGNMFFGNGRYYRLEAGDLRSGLLRQIRYYLYGIFLQEPHPFPHSSAVKFNPLQKLTYAAVMYVMFPAVVATGWILFFPDQIPERINGMTGVSAYAFGHSAIGYLLSLFSVVHIYLGTTGVTVGALFRAMITGHSHS